MKRVGLFGGTFNPVHCGHTQLAQWLVDHHIVDEVWMVLSPQNPLKERHDDATDLDRKAMLQLACDNLTGVKPCFEEFNLPRPSYTITTLRHLASKYPECHFSQIIGADNWQIFNQWREHQAILDNFGVIIYPRPGYECPEAVDAPMLDISSTQIRQMHDFKSTSQLLHPAVAQYITNHNLYAHLK